MPISKYRPMRRLLPPLLTLSFLTTACANHAAVAPVPGQLSTFDAYSYRVLYDTQAALNSFKTDVASGKVTETPTLKTVLNQAISDYDTANTIYQAWRAAGGNSSASATAPVTAAINKVQSDITGIAAQVTGGK